ncbi:MAG: hypothetical protein GX166_08260 [Clostridiaceae bacterium]|nr:hypothetical protein [Clostridiaceae bacterium]
MTVAIMTAMQIAHTTYTTLLPLSFVTGGDVSAGLWVLGASVGSGVGSGVGEGVAFASSNVIPYTSISKKSADDVKGITFVT